MKLLSAAVLAITLTFSNGATAGGNPSSLLEMTKAQIELLTHAWHVAVRDGHKKPRIVQAVVMQESKAGGIKNWRVAGLTNKPGDRYAGICQVKLAAANAVMKAYPEMWSKLDTRTDEELWARLILDDKFNIEICSKYLLLMGVNTNPLRGITAFNRGPGGVKLISNYADFGYTKGVIAYTQRLAKLVGILPDTMVPIDEENVIETQEEIESLPILLSANSDPTID